MADISGFNASQVDPAKDFEALPPARYPVMITESEWVDVKGSDGKYRYLKFTFVVTDGPYKGRNLWANLNLINKTPKAVEIANGQLSAICRAVKIYEPGDTTNLHNLPLIVRVEQRQEGDKIYNDIKGFYPVDGQGAAAPAAPAGPGSSPAAPGKQAVGGGAAPAPWTKVK